jgi:NAD(P)-dependent dehydrogenase (short-subunit alcohol dehydrogenase family)
MAGESLRGKTALLTGAAKRIGRAIAIALADEGVNLVLHYSTSAREAEALAEEIHARGVGAWPVKADFEKPQEYENLVEYARQTAGRLDLLINNASTFPPGELREITFDDVVLTARINAWVPFLLSRQFAQHVGKGKIINLLDTRISGYDLAHSAYILSKHLLTVLTRMTAVEFAPDIMVNAVAPGLILPPPEKMKPIWRN